MLPVTVVVATRNRRQQLLRYLPRHEAPVVLVDNGSDDGTPDVVESAFPDVTVIRLGRNLGAAARNVGVASARTPYVAFADDDSYWEGDALRRAGDLFDAYPRAALMTGRVLVGEQGRVDTISDEMAAAALGVEPDLPGPSVLGFLACAAVVRRKPFLQVGGFEPRLHLYGEEALVAMDLADAGWGLAYVPSLTVRHIPLPTGRDRCARRHRQARNDLLTTWLRRPVGVGARLAWRTARNHDGRVGLVQALGDLAWVRRHRRVVGPHLEAALRILEGGTPGRVAVPQPPAAARR